MPCLVISFLLSLFFSMLLLMLYLCMLYIFIFFFLYLMVNKADYNKGIYTPQKLPNLDLTTDAEYVHNLVNVFVNVQHYRLLYVYAIPA